MHRFLNRLFVFVLLASVVVADASAQENIDWRTRRIVLHRSFADELQQIGNWCRENRLPNQVGQTFKLYEKRDPGRQYIFLPTEKTMPTPPAGPLGQWLGKINDARRAHAAKVFALAKEAADAGAGGIAFQLLHEVIHFDRDHEAARRILHHKRNGKVWELWPEKTKTTVSRKQHEVMGWPEQTWSITRTPHFEIDSMAGEAATLQVAEELERWHYVWRQMFFDYWSNANAVKKWIDGKGSLRMPSRKFHVVLFSSLQDYVAQMPALVPGAEKSSGYYNDVRELSFFPYGTESSIRDTWRHELNHQLFRETIRARPEPFRDSMLWLDEGVAMYFESLDDHDDYVTLGGFETRRLQYARIRRLRENFYVPMAELSSLSLAQLQARPDIAKIYSQSAGMVHMLMDRNRGQGQQVLLEYMKAIHRRPTAPEVLEKMLGTTWAQLDKDYKPYLEVDSSTVASYLTLPLTRTELALPGADLSLDAFESIGQCTNLIWLDLSESTITKNAIRELKGCDELQQLFLNRCPIEKGAIGSLASLDKLETLDLSASSVDDGELKQLTQIKNLSHLLLAYTRVTSSGLADLDRLPNLKQLDVTGSQISASALNAWRSRHPGVEVTFATPISSAGGN